MTTAQEDFGDLMTDEVEVYKPTDTADFYRKPTYPDDPTATYPAFVQHQVHQVRDSVGDVVVSSATAIVLATVDPVTGLSSFPDIATMYRVVLPGGFAPAIAAIERRRDEVGPHHVTIHFV